MWHTDPYSADGDITQCSPYIHSPWCFAVAVGIAVEHIQNCVKIVWPAGKHNEMKYLHLAYLIRNITWHAHCTLYTRAHNVTQTHKTIRKHNASLCLLSTFCLLARWANTKSRAVVSAKDASSRILCFLCPVSFSLSWTGWWCRSPSHMTAAGLHSQKSHVYPYRQWHLTEWVIFFFFFF